MKTTLLTAIFSLIFCTQLHSQRPDIDSLINEIDSYNRLDHARIGFGGQRSKQYNRFIELSKKATSEELLNLLKHENTVVQGYAGWALIEKRYEQLDSVFSYFGKTGLTVKTISGCLGSRESLLHSFYDRLDWQLRFHSTSVSDSLLLQKQISKMDSLILFDRIKGKREFPPDYFMSMRRDTTEALPDFPVVDKYLLSRVLRNNKAHPGRYAAIRKWALEKDNDDALIPLALYQQKSDIDDFIRLGKQSFKIIPYFRAPELREFLESYSREYYSNDYFTALASFKDQASLDSLSSIYQRLHKRNSETLITDMANAIYKQFDPLYTNLSLNIMSEHGYIRIELAEKWINERPKEIAQASIERLKKGQDLFLINPAYMFYEEKIKSQIHELTYKYYPDNMSEICSNFISKADSYEMEIYTDLARKHKILATSNVILERLERKSHAFEIYHLTQTLLSFEQKKDYDKLRPLLNSSQKDWDGGNWSKHFRELFIKYDFSLN